MLLIPFNLPKSEEIGLSVNKSLTQISFQNSCRAVLVVGTISYLEVVAFEQCCYQICWWWWSLTSHYIKESLSGNDQCVST